MVTGQKLGPYEILAKLGEGGMGEVYRARDVKLKRDVALKVLPDLFARDHDRMSRFQREAELLASLNHPNIATIHGVEDNALVMELVEGETLKGPLAIADALRAARQIAEALEYAHDRGVIHRDLKPANVKITPDGVVKLLDFGLAKAIEDPSAADEKANSPTLTVNATHAGLILGTAAYMSPEQAHGRPADRRADIWSFGTVLYELLTGQPTFTGESVSDTLASVLKLDPDLNALPRDTPAAIRKLLQRCLTRDRKHRLQAIGEARIVIDDVLSGKAHKQVAPREASRWNTRHALAAWTVAAVLAIMLGLATWQAFQPPEIPTLRIARLTADAPVANVHGAIALSRDGSMLAFVGGPKQQIHVRAIDQFEAKPLNGAERATSLSFSPDGHRISFVDNMGPPDSSSRLRTVSIDGGPVQTLAVFRSALPPSKPTWGLDGNILFANNGALTRISPDGGTSETLAAPVVQQGELSYHGQELLPGGQHVLVSIATDVGVSSGFRIATLDLRTGQKTTLLERAGLAQYVPAQPPATSGHIVYHDRQTETLMAVAFDPRQVAITGAPVPVLEGVAPTRFQSGLFGISESGMLAYVETTGARSGSTLVWVDRNGTEEPAKAQARFYSSLRLSPDGQRAAVSIIEETEDIWVIDLTRGSPRRLTREGRSANAVWTPDGTRLFYERRQPGGAVMTVAADGSGSPSVVTTWKEGPLGPTSVSPDGKLLMGYYSTSRVAWSIPVSVAVKGPSTPDVFPDKRGVIAPKISPDGRWIAHSSEESGRPEVYVAAYPGPGARYTISTDGGANPRWSATGRELLYRNGDKMMAVEIETSPAFRAGAPKELFERASGDWDVDPNGKRFLMVKRPDLAPIERVNIILNWVEELRRRVPLPAS